MNYAESLRYLDELNTFGIRLGLARMEELCARLGNPERAYTTIHIAGTNGKGSAAQMMDAVSSGVGRAGRKETAEAHREDGLGGSLQKCASCHSFFSISCGTASSRMRCFS